jgi:hypothetical protein
MNCQDVNERLPEYVAGELPCGQQAEVQRHVEGCPGCKREYERMLKLKRGLQSLKIADPGEAFWQELSAKTLERINAQQVSSLQRMYGFIFSPRVAYAAGVAACLFLFIYMFNQYLLPVSFQRDKAGISQGIVAEAELYQEVLDDLLAGEELASVHWDLSADELDDFSRQLGAEFDLNGLLYNEFQPAVSYQLAEDMYQVIDELDAEELDDVYQSLITNLT